MTETEPDDEIVLTADGAVINSSEKVSTGQYETHTESATLEVTIEGVDVTDGVPDELMDKLTPIQRAMRNLVVQEAMDRKESTGGHPQENVRHDV